MTNLTVEQQAFKDRILDKDDRSSIVLEAVAGSGKTTSLLAPLKEVETNVAIIAFNKSIAEELKMKIAKMGLNTSLVQAGTCHSYGFNTLKQALGYCRVDGRKVQNIVDQYFMEKDTLPFNMKSMIRKLVSIGKQNGAGDLHEDRRMGFDVMDYSVWNEFIDHYDVNDSDTITNDEIIKHSIAVLRRSNQDRKVIDFEDMIYMPLRMNLSFPKFGIVMVDEAQDLNWSRRQMAERMVEPKLGRLVAVGDRRQAIYGFTGSGTDSLDQIKNQFNAVELPLTVCWRCDTDIIKFAQRWNPRIQPAPGKPAGTIKQIDFEDFMKNESHTNDKVMLCRNTKPLIQVAFAMIREGKAVFVEGRDIGEGLKNLAQRWKITKIHTLIERLNNYKQLETAKAIKNKKEEKIQYIEDQVETLMVIINRCMSLNKMTVQDVIDEINHLFTDTKDGKADRFTLSTIHKSKGREWGTVYWLNRSTTLPSKYAKQPWQLEQEYNLCYVAATRAMNNLVEVEAYL